MRPTNHIYGQWAGNPKGRPEDKSCCVEQVMEPGRGGLFHQCNRKRGHGPDGLWCAQHDPDKQAAKDRAYNEARDAREIDQKLIERTAKQLAKRLGCGTAYYHRGYKLDDCGLQRKLLIDFADVEALLKELGR